MTTKADFNAEEWQRVVEAPAIAALRIIAAHRGGTIRETVSMARAYAEVREHGAGGLLGEIVASPPQIDPKSLGAPDEMAPNAIRRVGEAVAVLEARAEPAEVDDYRRFVFDVAETVARAHKEGGFLGIGGQEVSEAEQAALDEIRAALDGGGAAA